MTTFSLCMIVKNEEQVLKRCLDSIYDLVDEIIIVDTGSTDSTKEIAKRYTDKIYDFEWINDFSAARNYAFSKCTMDYIYVADADEYLDDDNRFQFKVLKENIYPEIEIVQMMYKTISHDTVLNIYKEYRPKLFKRLREFTWINPVHETVRLDPLVFDSDIVVTHAPLSNHSKRDLSIFKEVLEKDGALPDDLIQMYACELYKNGTDEDFMEASKYFTVIENFEELKNSDGEKILTAFDYFRIPISVKCLRLFHDNSFEKYALLANDFFEGENSEICYELGEYYIENKAYDNAQKYFLKAHMGSSTLDIHVSGDYALKKLIKCCEMTINQYEEYKLANGADNKMDALIDETKAVMEKYQLTLNDWKMPEENVV